MRPLHPCTVRFGKWRIQISERKKGRRKLEWGKRIPFLGTHKNNMFMRRRFFYSILACVTFLFALSLQRQAALLEKATLVRRPPHSPPPAPVVVPTPSPVPAITIAPTTLPPPPAPTQTGLCIMPGNPQGAPSQECFDSPNFQSVIAAVNGCETIRCACLGGTGNASVHNGQSTCSKAPQCSSLGISEAGSKKKKIKV